jgi:hypothetical protein
MIDSGNHHNQILVEVHPVTSVVITPVRAGNHPVTFVVRAAVKAEDRFLSFVVIAAVKDGNTKGCFGREITERHLFFLLESYSVQEQ